MPRPLAPVHRHPAGLAPNNPKISSRRNCVISSGSWCAATRRRMKTSKTTVVALAEMCKVAPISPSIPFHLYMQMFCSVESCIKWSYVDLLVLFFSVKNILASNWQGNLNTIKSDAGGRYHFSFHLFYHLDSAQRVDIDIVMLIISVTKSRINWEPQHSTARFLNNDSPKWNISK